MGFTDIVRGLLDDTQRLIRDEIALARSEVRQNIKSAVAGAAVLAIGGVFAVVGFIYVALMAVFLISLVLPAWLAALIIGFFLLIVGGIMLLVGMNMLSKATAKPEETIETLREDREWLRRQMR